MKDSALKIILSYTEAWCLEALGVDEVYVSTDTTPETVIDSLFESKEVLEAIYAKGKEIFVAHPRRACHYDVNSGLWVRHENKTTIPLLNIGILLEDWDFVNAHNPYQENV